MMTLRILALAVALGAIADPVLTVKRAQPLPIDVRLPSQGSPVFSDSVAARAQMLEALGDTVTTASVAAPAAVVVVGDASVGDLPLNVPISAIALSPDLSPNVRIVDVATPPAIAGQVASVAARIEASGMRGRTTRVSIEQYGVTVAEAAHTWHQDREDHTITLKWFPPQPGVHVVRVRASMLEGEQSPHDNVADVAMTTTARRLRVLAYEPRPSWTMAFVRRALEDEPTFDVSSIVAVSPRLEARAGAPPRGVVASTLESYDALLVGAPESLTAADVSALDDFARIRGGLVVLLPDRRPAGAYVRLVPTSGFDEVLLENPVKLEAGSVSLVGSEVAVPRTRGAGITPLATFARGDATLPAIAAWPRGAGRVLFSGALDAWRYRTRDDSAFVRFWTGTIAAYASAAPPPIGVTVDPVIAPPLVPVTVRVTVRPTEYASNGGDTAVPPVAATVIGEHGDEHDIRLWPTAEVGRFEGSIVPHGIGRYSVRARLTNATASAETPLLIAENVVLAAGTQAKRLKTLTRVTGGVFAAAGDLGALKRHLASIQRPEIDVPVRPARSMWWYSVFAALVCAEWAAARKRSR